MAGKVQIEWPSDQEMLKKAGELSTLQALADHLGQNRMSLSAHLKSRGIKDKIQRQLRRRRVSAKPPKLDEDESSPAERELARKLHQAQARAATNRVEVREAKAQADEAEGERDRLQAELDLLTQVENVPAPEWLDVVRDDGTHHGTLVANFSDYHIGEVVDPEEMVGYNAYDPAIAEKRIRRFTERTILVARQYLAGVAYDGVVVPNLGDTISGDIHDEFAQTNEWSNYEAIPHAVVWVTEMIGTLADEFGRVHVPCCPGNHPRDSRKPRYKKRSAHNADTLISRLVAKNFHSDDRVTFDIPGALTAYFTVYETRFRIEHGDEAKGGSGIQGAMLPIALRTHRVRKQAQAEGQPFDVLLMGHWHQLMSFPAKGFIVNGAGKGYDEYARGKGFEPEPPQQALFVVTPEHGISAQLPLFVAKRSDEGW